MLTERPEKKKLPAAFRSWDLDFIFWAPSYSILFKTK